MSIIDASIADVGDGYIWNGYFGEADEFAGPAAWASVIVRKRISCFFY